MIRRQFYIELGKLLYSISKADGLIQEKEREVIDRIILKELEKHKNTFSGNVQGKEILLTKLGFKSSERISLTVSEAYHSFNKFMKKNNQQIGDKQKELAIELIRKVALATRGISKQEEGIIQELLSYLNVKI